MLAVPRGSVANFETLDDLMDQAVAAADEGLLLVPGTQPEVQEMRTWLCHQVREQSLGATSRCRGWRGPTSGSRATVDYGDWDPQEVSPGLALLATDESSVVVAVSPTALHLLGFGDAVRAGRPPGDRDHPAAVPPGAHRRHDAPRGQRRSPLLGVPVTVPVLLAEGSEKTVVLRIDPPQSEGTRSSRRVLPAPGARRRLTGPSRAGRTGGLWGTGQPSGSPSASRW